jgi:signal transduction histidine kinase
VILKASVATNLPPVEADPDKIERVLYNLVDNAIKFTPEEGVVSLYADQLDKHFIRVAVTDTGQGIPVEMRDHIFDRYQQISGTYARRRGTGLGLTYCKMAVEAHSGRIWIEDNVGGGAVFAFTLPIARLG